MSVYPNYNTHPLILHTNYTPKSPNRQRLLAYGPNSPARAVTRRGRGEKPPKFLSDSPQIRNSRWGIITNYFEPTKVKRRNVLPLGNPPLIKRKLIGRFAQQHRNTRKRERNNGNNSNSNANNGNNSHNNRASNRSAKRQRVDGTQIFSNGSNGI